MKEKEVLHTEIDHTIEETQPHLLNFIRNDYCTLDNYEDKTIKGTQQQLAGTKKLMILLILVQLLRSTHKRGEKQDLEHEASKMYW